MNRPAPGRLAPEPTPPITVSPAAIGVVATRLADALTTGDIVYIATDEQRGGKKWICFGAIILHRSILDAVDSLRSA